MDILSEIKRTKKNKKMNYVFVDYENVALKGLEGVENLDKDSVVFILFSKNTASLPIETAAKIGKAECSIRYIETVKGNNALDFILSSLLGYFVKASAKKDNYYIVSKDTGYQPLVDFWKENGAELQIITSPLEIKNDEIAVDNSKSTTQKKKATVSNDKQVMLATIGNQLTKEKKEIKDKVMSALKNTTKKVELHTKLQQIFKSSKKADNIYNKVKKYFK